MSPPAGAAADGSARIPSRPSSLIASVIWASETATPVPSDSRMARSTRSPCWMGESQAMLCAMVAPGSPSGTAEAAPRWIAFTIGAHATG